MNHWQNRCSGCGTSLPWRGAPGLGIHDWGERLPYRRAENRNDRQESCAGSSSNNDEAPWWMMIPMLCHPHSPHTSSAPKRNRRSLCAITKYQVCCLWIGANSRCRPCLRWFMPDPRSRRVSSAPSLRRAMDLQHSLSAVPIWFSVAAGNTRDSIGAASPMYTNPLFITSKHRLQCPAVPG